MSGQGGKSRSVGVRVWGEIKSNLSLKTAFRSAAVGIRAGGRT